MTKCREVFHVVDGFALYRYQSISTLEDSASRNLKQNLSYVWYKRRSETRM